MIMPDTKTLTFAIGGALVAGIVWMTFWRRADKNPEPLSIVLLCFILGAMAVPIAQVLQGLVQDYVSGSTHKIILWASIEEILKYLAAAILVFKSRHLDEPIDYAMYLVASALGFATLENILFLVNPLFMGDTIVSLLAGNLRFLGATLMHGVTSMFVGLCMGLVFYKNYAVRKLAIIFGLAGAIALHSIFNFFIIEKTQQSFFVVYGYLWITTVIILMIVEKVRRMSIDESINK
ncbi:MAG: RsiW-degrading membrane proteinase PrsW (M82 family) [Flavobacteriaceae bacterium]|jgi:RsiW-degrading membrane proteinase PrsW (M82 family)